MTQPLSPPNRWQIVPELPGLTGNLARIAWNVQADTRLPHEDHVEMSGQQVSVIVRYGADAQRRGHVTLEAIWPLLRTTPDDVRGYLKRTLHAANSPRLLLNGEGLEAATLLEVRFDGVLQLTYRHTNGLLIYRDITVSPMLPAIIEQWSFRAQAQPLDARVENIHISETTQGMYGEYILETQCQGETAWALRPRAPAAFAVLHTARRVDSKWEVPDAGQSVKQRVTFLMQSQQTLQLRTPEPMLNVAFDMAKVRAAESIFATKRGLMHSPGGGRYYGGVWANDQAEYAGPFFPFLGSRKANDASLNAYRLFAGAMTADFDKNIPSSFEMEGDVEIHAGGDRGDAAMVAYGAARFALARGSRAFALSLWPAIAWCLEYCRRKVNDEGVVESDTDELEGRFPTGNANLSTSTLYYGALRSAADLARSLDKSPEIAAELEARAEQMAMAIETYFGADVEGFATYRYYAGNTTLRAWIALPLTMELFARREGTLAALFSPRLWTPDGLATEAGNAIFWDRATLYALRGVFQAGATQSALDYLTAYTRRRLLGDHVPYAVEAYPEGGQAHLSAESALYCRIFVEGLFGITPTGLNRFRCTPRLPAAWPTMELRNLRAFGSRFSLAVTREASGDLTLAVAHNAQTRRETLPDGAAFTVTL